MEIYNSEGVRTHYMVSALSDVVEFRDAVAWLLKTNDNFKLTNPHQQQ